MDRPKALSTCLVKRSRMPLNFLQVAQIARVDLPVLVAYLHVLQIGLHADFASLQEMSDLAAFDLTVVVPDLDLMIDYPDSLSYQSWCLKPVVLDFSLK